MPKFRLDDTQTDDIVGASIPGALKMKSQNIKSYANYATTSDQMSSIR